MIGNNILLSWLLEEDNPEVKLRTLTEYLEYSEESQEVRQAKAELIKAPIFHQASEMLTYEKIWPRYDALTAFAEWGLTRNDLNIDKEVAKVIEDSGFKPMCGEALLLRNLVKLGYCEEEKVRTEIYSALGKIKEDGGFGCLSKSKKINDPALPHKSCARITANYLLLIAEMKLKGMEIPCEKELVQYFLKRGVIFRTDNPQAVVVEEMANTFYPMDAVKVGLQNTLYALTVLGAGKSSQCDKAWERLEEKKAEEGKYILGKCKTIPSFKAGKPGKVNKWVTLYALMAKKGR